MTDPPNLPRETFLAVTHPSSRRRQKIIKAFTLLLLTTVALTIGATEEDDPLSLAEMYKHSCEIVAKINKEDWKSLETIPDIWGSIETLKIHLNNEKIEGIGAYRKTTENGISET